MDDPGAEEVLGFGPDRPRRGPTGTARSHPRLAALVAVLCVAGVAGYAVAHLRAHPVALPAVAAAEPATGVGSATTAAWSEGVDGRPQGDPVVRLTGAVAFSAVARDGVSVLGVVGPGVGASRVPPTVVDPVHGRTTVALAAPVDCAAVPLPVPAAAYGLRVRVTDGARSRTGTVPAGALATAWAAQVRTACGPWSARRDLTVTQPSRTWHRWPTSSTSS